MEALEKHYVPQVNTIYERYLFRCATQVSESFDSYLAKLRKLASSCEYGALMDEMIRDNIVYGIVDSSVRSRMLRDSKLTLQKAVDFCRANELAVSQAKVMQNEATVNSPRAGSRTVDLELPNRKLI